ncbi:UvrD/REP helicase amine-terminal domain protein (macronuclear) [Tetrahymena thermophila SB210]|uniref:UvrD/REP helicase amine-terminal domain protein n=1 Tax=Tetrahymena thermophila (strain SB210) TaxID=312017 RepID=Q23Q43_TETTS|nr:UvrD/REP helicase amine-terminal domain protein [Tetrahymena thermophila SB210]EAR98741.2 UvrD/REP helicase amine-terminal domain protein [Tetrahymena thermophila SB210]|eukprot:XP_001018986.2 UvrD/REP helicase amine-terminal domain protein [Tetrahymena thermophila SB210]
MDPYTYLPEITSTLEENIQKIHFLCTKLPYRGVNWTYYHNINSIIVEWMRQQTIRFEQQEQSGEFYQKYKDLYLLGRKSVEAELRYQNLLHKSIFKCNYTDNFVNEFSKNSIQKQKVIFSYMNYIAQGYFRQIKDIFDIFEVPHKGQELEKMFCVKVMHNKYLVFLVTVQTIPVHSNHRKLAKMNFTQVIVFLDILTPAQADQLKNKAHPKVYTKVLQNYVSEPGYMINHKMLNPYTCSEKNLFIYDNGRYIYNYPPQSQDPALHSNNPFYESVLSYLPNNFYQHKFQDSDQETYYYDARKQRWVLQDQNFLRDLQSMRDYQQQVSNHVISQCLNFGSAQKLVNVLQKIPNFKVKLSSEQSHIISCSGNVVCIGRSGTGKTTSAVLRMFALEMLFKYRLHVYHNRHMKLASQTRFNPKDLDKMVGLRCIFVTASPVLTNEIKRYYDRLTKQLKEELIKRDEKLHAEQLEKLIQQKKDQQNDEKQDKTESNEADKELDAEKEEIEILMEKQFENLQLNKEISTDGAAQNDAEDAQQEIKEEKITFEDDDAEKLEKEMDKYENLSNMSPQDFPAFMTVRNLIMLIDASLSYPFFKRNKEGKIKGQTAQNTWHNEQKGTLYINNFHKHQINESNLKDADQIMEKMNIGLEDDDEEEEIQNIDNLNEYQINQQYQQTIRQQQKKINQIAASKAKQVSKAKKMAYEIDFEYFKRFFWKRIQNKVIGFKSLDVHFVWTEIYSIIKGSSQSCFYWSGVSYGLSKYIYTQQQTRLKSHEIDKLYEIYQEYERWKDQEGSYDFMDIVNYVIRSINYGFNKNIQYLHYIMVDEVQDLPMNILYLLKKMTTNGIFYSGDTAQTIAQGVGFRYGSLKSLFDNKSVGQYYTDSKSITDDVTIQQLTVNFRSHNKILYLANSVIDLLEFFFPETIDRLKKEKSSIDGPKPIILGESDPDLLFCILTGDSSFKSERHSSNQGAMGRNPIEFGCSQVVIVRNQESKKNLPPMLAHALCLTIYEAKGLEFDDVILYNFFQDSTMQPQKWNLLRYVSYLNQFMTKEKFNEMIEEQEIERLHRIHYIQLLRTEIIEQDWKDKQAMNKLQYIMDNEKRLSQLKILNDRAVQREQKMEELQQQEQALQSDAVYGTPVKGEENLIKVVKLNLNQEEFKKNNISQKDFSQLCLELKQLYVAITRPKNRVIIYDENADARQIIQEYWENLGCVEVITSEVLSGMVDQKNVQESGINIKDALLRKSDSNQWKQQGLRMMKMRYFQQAMLCFEKAGCQEYMEQAKIFHLADHAKEMLEEAQREYIFLDQGIMEYSSMSKTEKDTKKAQINLQMKIARKEFTQVGEIFYNREQYKQAAKCFFSALNYQRAADCYIKIGNIRSAAECYYIIQDYVRASELFLEGKEYVKAIECNDLLENWGKILEIINLAKGSMTLKTRELYIKKYAPLALEELVSNIGLSKIEVTTKQQQKQKKILELIVQEQINEEEEDEENATLEQSQQKNKENESEEEEEIEDEKSGQQKEQADQQKETKSILDDLNKQEEEEDKDDEEDEDEHDSVDKIDLDDISQDESVEKINKTKQTQKSAADNNKSVSNADFSVIDKTQGQMQDVSVIEKSVKQSRHDNTSFIDNISFNDSSKDEDANEDLNLSSLTLDFIKSKNQLSDFEHLSEFDPEDEWLKMETGSIAEVIQKSRDSGIFSCSEFSSLNIADMMSTKAQMIKTSADIFIQDEIMQQVIKYMSMFSDNFKTEILKIKSKDALLTSRNEQHDDTLTEYGANELLIDLDNIDINFLYLILDTLEYYNIFRLAIFVCNRYKLSKKVGRYLISIAHKFSFLAHEDASLDFTLLNLTPEKQKKIEKAIIANIAIHNLFEVINPEFIRLKEADEVPNENNSLGIEVYRGFLSLGYWKKILFIMDYKRSLELAYFFSDFNSYKTIFLNFNKKYKNKAACISSIKNGEPDFQCLPFDIPKTAEEIEFAIVVLEHVITFQNSKQKLSKSTTHNLSFSSRSQMMNAEGQYEKIPQFPSYFTYNAIFWKYINHKVSKGFAKQNNEDSQFFKYVGQCAKNALEILDKKDNFESDLINLRIFDVFSFLSNLFFQLQFQDKLFQILIQHLDLDDFQNFVLIINRILKMFSNINTEQRKSYLILRALVSPLKVRLNMNTTDLLSAFGQTKVNIHKSSRLIAYFLQKKNEAAAKLKVENVIIKIMQFEEFCLKKRGKILKQYEKEYRQYRNETNQLQAQITALLNKGDKRSIQEASYLVNNVEEKENLMNYVKQIEFLEKKQKNKYYFLDLDCEFIAAPIQDVLQFFQENLYKLTIPLVHRKISTSIKLSGTKNYTIERLFLISAYNIAFSQILKETDQIMKSTEGYDLLSKTKGYVPPEYKKYKKSNPLYKFFKLEYLKQIEEQNEEEEDEDIQQYMEYEGIKKKSKKINYPLLKKCKRQLSQCLQNIYQGYWEVSISPYVRNVLLQIVLKTINSYEFSSPFDFKSIQKYAQFLNIVNHTSYLNNFKVSQNLRIDAKLIIENVYNHRNGLIQKYINNTLSILDKHFDQLEFQEKMHQLEYCAIWATLSYLASKGDTFNFYLNQNFLKLLPPLKFTEFTTDQKDDNVISVPARFALEVSIQPIKSLDTIVEIFQFIADIFTKQGTQIVQRKAVFQRLLQLIFIVLFNLKKINNDLAQEILTLIDLLDQEEQLQKIIDKIDFWEDLIQCQNEKEIEEIIPLMISENLFEFEESYEKADIVQEIQIENIISKSITEEVRQKITNQQILHDQIQHSKKITASRIILNNYNYNKQEMWKAQSRLCKNQTQLLILSRFNNKHMLPTESLISANLKNSQIFNFFEENDNIVSDIICNMTSNSVFDPLDYHYLLLLLDQADRRQGEYEKHLLSLVKENDQSKNQFINKLVQEIQKKKEELLNWATQQFSKENQDPQVFFLQNKMSIAIKWAKMGYINDAKKLVTDINDDFKLKEAQSLKLNMNNQPPKIGNKFKKNKQAKK